LKQFLQSKPIPSILRGSHYLKDNYKNKPHGQSPWSVVSHKNIGVIPRAEPYRNEGNVCRRALW